MGKTHIVLEKYVKFEKNIQLQFSSVCLHPVSSQHLYKLGGLSVIVILFKINN